MADIKDNSNCTLYLVRHGETEWNINGRIQGQLDSPLTQRGIDETAELAKQLQAIHFDAIFSSDLSRAYHTAEILKLDRQLAIATHQALRERTFGIHDGSYGNEFEKSVQDLLKLHATLSDEQKWKFKFTPGYESDEELVTRFITHIREIAVGYKNKTVLVVSHGGNLRTFLTHLGYAPHGVLTPGTFKNAGYIKVRSDGVDFFIDEVRGVDKTAGIKSKVL